MTDRRGYRATGPTAHPRCLDESFNTTGASGETVTLDVTPLLPLDSVTLKEVPLEEGPGAGQYSVAGKVVTLNGAHDASDRGLRVVYRIKESLFIPPGGGGGSQDVNIVSPLGQDAMAGSVPVVVASDQSPVPVSGPLTDAQLRASPVPIEGNVGVLGAVEVMNDLGNPVPVSGTVGVSGEVEVKNDSGNPLKVAVQEALPAGTNEVGGVRLRAQRDDAAPATIAEDAFGDLRATEQRALHVNLRAVGGTEVVLQPVSTFDHGRKNIGTVAAQITSTSIVAQHGVIVEASEKNTALVFVGNSDVTAGTMEATDGYELSPGASLFVPIDNANKVHVIAAAANQNVYWAVA